MVISAGVMLRIFFLRRLLKSGIILLFNSLLERPNLKVHLPRKIIKHKKRPIGSFSCLVISAGVEPALTGWKPVVLTVILRDQFRNVPLYYNRFKKIGNSYFYEKSIFSRLGIESSQFIIFFRLKTWPKLFLYFLTAQNRIRRIISFSKWRMRLKCHRR